MPNRLMGNTNYIFFKKLVIQIRCDSFPLKQKSAENEVSVHWFLVTTAILLLKINLCKLYVFHAFVYVVLEPFAGAA